MSEVGFCPGNVQERLARGSLVCFTFPPKCSSRGNRNLLTAVGGIPVVYS